MDAPVTAMRYRAFISYRHADKDWGDWLHRALETYRVPRELVGTIGETGPVPARLTPVFRDREELGAAHDLGERLQAALEGSANLIVICSPRAAQSKWVNEEILATKRLGRSHRIFAIVVDGEPNSPDPSLECFPPALKYEIGPDGNLSDRLAEPLAADAREHADGKDNAKLKLIAGLIGVPYDKLRRRELEAQRRAFRRFAVIAGSIAIIFAGLAAAAGWFGYQATLERDRAQANLAAAIEAAERETKRIETDMLGRQRLPRDEAGHMLEGMSTLLEKLAEGQPLSPEGERARWKTMIRRADAALTLGELEQAEAHAQNALTLADELSAGAPGDPVAQHNLLQSLIKAGDIIYKRADFPASTALYDRALELAEAYSAAAPDDRDLKGDLATAYLRNGMSALARDDMEATRDEFARAIVVSEELVAADPGNAERRKALALGYNLLGRIQTYTGELDEALDVLRKALAINSGLAAEDPLSTAARYSAADNEVSIAYAQYRQGDREEALAGFQRALAVIGPMADADPINADLQNATAFIHSVIGDAEIDGGNLEAAEAAYTKNQAILKRLVDFSPNDVVLRSRYAWAIVRTGGVQLKREDYAAARASFLEGTAIMETADRDDGEAVVHQREVASMKERVAVAEDRLGNRAEALRQLTEADAILKPLLAASPDNPDYVAAATLVARQLALLQRGEPLEA